MLNRSTFYCDESGNSGFNLRDTSQPFYVTGGVLIPRAAHQKLASVIAVVRPEGAGERKANAMMKTPTGRDALCRALDRAFGLGCQPFFLISEKRFNIAQKIVDVFFDPAHNDAASWLSLVDDVARERVENELYLLGAELDQFADAYRDPNRETWKEAISALQQECRKRRWSQLESTFAGALRHIDVILEQENQAGRALLGGGSSYHFHFASIQVPMFLHVARLVDAVLERAGARGTVCHDETRKFEQAFQTSFSWIKGTTGDSAPWTSGVYRRLGITQLDGLAFANSETSEGLQLADMLIGLVSWATARSWRQEQEDGFPRMAYHLLGLLVGDSPTHARIVVSEQAKGRLLDILFPEMLRRQSPTVALKGRPSET